MTRLTRSPSTLGPSSRPGTATAPGTRACQGGGTTWSHGHSSRMPPSRKPPSELPAGGTSGCRTMK